MSASDYFALLFRQTTRLSERLCQAVETLKRQSGMTVVHKSQTLLVLAPCTTPSLCLPDDGGVVLGYLFNRATASRVSVPGPAAGIAAEDFVKAYWGGYVALRSRHLTPEVLRDPSGTLPCYQAEIDDVHIVTSRPELLFELALLKADLDWTILAQTLVFRDIKPARTMLRGLSEILPGVVGRVYPTGIETRCVWSPWAFIQPSPASIRFEDAAALIRATVTECGRAWSDCFDHPVLEISGGLDSAIVASVVTKDVGSAAITYAAIRGDPDELPYARAVADWLGLELTIIPARLDLIEILRSNSADLPRPYSRSFSQAYDQAAQLHADSLDADVIFSGGGGDSVFCYLQSISPIFDRIAIEGFGHGILSTMRDVAVLGNTSIWDIARRMIRRSLKHRRPPWHVDTRLIDKVLLRTLPFPHGHPWTDVPAGAPSGKASHVYSLIMIQNYLEGHAQAAAAPIISPLLSQPVLEACLSIPTWLWCCGGINRAVARTAFVSALPESVVARQSKGVFDSFAAKLIAANCKTIRDLLLGGALAEQGLVDEPAVERALVDAGAGLRVRIAQLVDAEVWARSWIARE